MRKLLLQTWEICEKDCMRQNYDRLQEEIKKREENEEIDEVRVITYNITG